MEWTANMPENYTRGYAQLQDEENEANEDDQEDNQEQEADEGESSSEDELVGVHDDEDAEIASSSGSSGDDALAQIKEDNTFLGLNESSSDDELVQLNKDDSSSSSSDSSDSSDSDDEPVRSKKKAVDSEKKSSTRYSLNKVNTGLLGDARTVMEKLENLEAEAMTDAIEKHKLFAKAGQRAIDSENAEVNSDKKNALAKSDVRQNKRELTRLLKEAKWQKKQDTRRQAAVKKAKKRSAIAKEARAKKDAHVAKKEQTKGDAIAEHQAKKNATTLATTIAPAAAPVSVDAPAPAL